MNIGDLPVELLEKILGELPFPWRNAAAGVSRRFREAAGVRCHAVEQGTSIQGAIDAARDGDTVLVAPGLYEEVIEVHRCVRVASAPGTLARAPYEHPDCPVGARIQGLAAEPAEAPRGLGRARPRPSGLTDLVTSLGSQLQASVSAIQAAHRTVEQLLGVGLGAGEGERLSSVLDGFSDLVQRVREVEGEASGHAREVVGRCRAWGEDLDPAEERRFRARYGEGRLGTSRGRATVQAPIGPVTVVVTALKATLVDLCLRSPEADWNRSMVSFGPGSNCVTLERCELQGHSGLILPARSPSRLLRLLGCHLQSVMDCPAVMALGGVLHLEDTSIDQCCEAVVVRPPAHATVTRCELSFNEVGLLFEGRGSVSHTVLWGNNALCDARLAATAFTSSLPLEAPTRVRTPGGHLVAWNNWCHRRIRQCYGVPSDQRREMFERSVAAVKRIEAKVGRASCRERV